MNNRVKKVFDEMAQPLDKRQAAIDIAKELDDKGVLPEQFAHMKQFFNEIPWRDDPKVYNRVVEAAKKAAKKSKK